ncbi:MAG: hypothetical protein QM528_03370 [Phycisphaerales bacterium]|nr:hypothetical protein [Phycisphaerales bacterium]
MEKRYEYTPDPIVEPLLPHEIFVFGSNLAGLHTGGAAKIALEKYKALQGQGVGWQGQSYAIPTMQGGVETIKPHVDSFISLAQDNPKYVFYVTRIGCGRAGFSDKDIAPLFKNALILKNVCLPESFVTLLHVMGHNPTSVANEIKDKIPTINHKIKSTPLSSAIVKNLSIDNIMYAEISSCGAMGSGGDARCYVFMDNKFICYEGGFNCYGSSDKEEDDLSKAAKQFEKLINDNFKEIRSYKNGMVDIQAAPDSLFNYYHDGLGHDVYVNKKYPLYTDTHHFIYQKGSRVHHLYCVAEAVFDSIMRRYSPKGVY